MWTIVSIPLASKLHYWPSRRSSSVFYGSCTAKVMVRNFR